MGDQELLAFDASLRARIAAAKFVLRDRGSPGHAEQSALQAAAVIELPRGKSITAEDVATLGNSIAKVNWAPVDVDRVLHAIPKAKSSANGRRRKQQSFEHVLHYGSKSFWDFVQADDSGEDTKLQTIFDLLGALGLRNPSEPCLKFMTSLWMVLTNKSAGVQLSNMDKMVSLATLKDRWSKIKYRLHEPPIYLEVLPELPHQFQSRFPSLWEVIFTPTIGVPIACPIAVHTLRSLDHSYGCRGGIMKARSCEQLAVTPYHQQQYQQQQQQPCRPGGFETLVHDLFRMQSTLLETQMLQGQRPATSAPIFLTPANLNRGQASSSSMASTGINDSTVRVEELPDSLGGGALVPLPALPATSEQGHPPVLADMPPPSAVAGVGMAWGPESVNEVLDMFLDRRAHAAIEKRAMKRPAAASCTDTEGEEPLETPAKKPLAIPGKKSMAKKPIATPDKLCIGEKHDGKPLKDAPQVLGCSRCRKAPAGCAQCRSPEFRGKRG